MFKKKIKQEIDQMSLSELVAYSNEMNKPSGGIKTIHTIIRNAFITQKSTILEIGCNTGYSSIEIKRLTGANVYGIDTIKRSIKLARQNAERTGLKIKFSIADATKLKFKDESFDVVFCSNVTSFIKNKELAITNYKRVLKQYGFLAAVPIYYIRKPPVSLLKKVSKELNAQIKYYTKKEWVKIFEDESLELCYLEDYIYKTNTPDEIDAYIKNVILKSPVLIHAPNDVKKAIYNKYFKQLMIFNENLKYTGFFISIYRKIPLDYQKELFPSIPLVHKWK
jgi:ubiquinone/menaquinone biosynthesis C-methylase UbiE